MSQGHPQFVEAETDLMWPWHMVRSEGQSQGDLCWGGGAGWGRPVASMQVDGTPSWHGPKSPWHSSWIYVLDWVRAGGRVGCTLLRLPVVLSLMGWAECQP